MFATLSKSFVILISKSPQHVATSDDTPDRSDCFSNYMFTPIRDQGSLPYGSVR